eukprot:CAMPEP_0197051166 /NCGR_PEP_ID=MMETSP1384-20130603/25900_1 /TAXON_ID=29189 /ORGANISM="Ammonia sp." /LENGTH=68 /DNA_ID=CAMNT_0042483683 /DNA_START=350 /DNA_END=553 /DNA_ORIENTATION=+
MTHIISRGPGIQSGRISDAGITALQIVDGARCEINMTASHHGAIGHDISSEAAGSVDVMVATESTEPS